MQGLRRDKETFGGQLAKIIEVSLKFYRKERLNIVEGGELVKISIKCEVYSYIKLMIGFIVKNNTGLTLFGDNTKFW